MDYINLKTALLKQKMTDTINNSQLPIGVILFVLKDLVYSLEDLYEKQVMKENDSYQQQIEEESAEALKETEEKEKETNE